MRFQHLNGQKQNYGPDDELQIPVQDENLNLQPGDASDVLTIEGLRRTFNSCSNCGVSWYDDHISLDCSECGGYAMRRPCVTCNGTCGGVWRRDVKASHVKKSAQWLGTCNLPSQWQATQVDSNLSRDVNANLNGNL